MSWLPAMASRMHQRYFQCQADAEPEAPLQMFGPDGEPDRPEPQERPAQQERPAKKERPEPQGRAEPKKRTAPQKRPGRAGPRNALDSYSERPEPVRESAEPVGALT